jgi:hypothetical protein
VPALPGPGARASRRTGQACAGGMSVRKAAAKFDVAPGTVQRISGGPFASAA